jgi:hypothetical protein
MTKRDPFHRASACDLRFGKYKGQTLEQIGDTEDGLIYLDWLIGVEWLNQYTRDMIGIYLNHSSVAPRVNQAIAEKR